MNNKKKKIIFVACDTSNLNKIRKIINQTKTDKIDIIPKFGLQFFYSKQGRKFLEKININFWLDLKPIYAKTSRVVFSHHKYS